MSLTSILDYGNKPYKELRSLLTDKFPKPKIDVGSLENALPVSKNHSVIGMAFDYLLRFELERKYHASVYTDTWTAEEGLQFFVRRRVSALKDGKRRKSRIDRIHEKFKKCKTVYQAYIKAEDPKVDPIIDACFFLAKLESVYRTTGQTIDYVTLSKGDKQDAVELKQLLQCCNLALFKPKEKIIMNPSFGKGSNLVRGADADLIVDDLLVDIKVVKEPKLTRPIYNQLLGYYLLYLIGGIDGHESIKINRLGVFFARHNTLWTIDIKAIGSEEAFQAARKMLTRLCRKSRNLEK